MKKLIALMLVLVMVVAMAACGSKPAAKTPLEGTMEENALKVMEISPVEFPGACIPVDMNDTDTLWYFTGLRSSEKLTDVVSYESMMGSHAFALVMVRVADAADAEAVAKEMNENIDTRKWVCVGADEKIVAGYSDTIMLIMLDSQLGLNAQSYLDAFKTVCGGELDFTM